MILNGLDRQEKNFIKEFKWNKNIPLPVKGSIVVLKNVKYVVIDIEYWVDSENVNSVDTIKVIAMDLDFKTTMGY